jgi:hypothetical protein
VKDYGASGRGDVDDSKAINAAIAEGNRCGKSCGNTFSQGAIIYFPVSISMPRQHKDWLEQADTVGKTEWHLQSLHTDHPVSLDRAVHFAILDGYH